jgi:hypothetical protein
MKAFLAAIAYAAFTTFLLAASFGLLALILHLFGGDN